MSKLITEEIIAVLPSHSQFRLQNNLYLDLHGLVFETSIYHWQDQPGSDCSNSRCPLQRPILISVSRNDNVTMRLFSIHTVCVWICENLTHTHAYSSDQTSSRRARRIFTLRTASLRGIAQTVVFTIIFTSHHITPLTECVCFVLFSVFVHICYVPICTHR